MARHASMYVYTRAVNIFDSRAVSNSAIGRGGKSFEEWLLPRTATLNPVLFSGRAGKGEHAYTCSARTVRKYVRLRRPLFLSLSHSLAPTPTPTLSLSVRSTGRFASLNIETVFI